MANRGARNIRNSIWNLINVTAYPILFLALTPWLINRLGEHLFGTWMILNAVVFITVQLLHFGVGPSLTIYIAESRGKQRSHVLNRFYNSALNFTALMALIVWVISLLSSWLVPMHWFEWEGITDTPDLRLAFMLTLSLIGVKLFEQVFIAFYKGFEEYDTLTKFMISQKLGALLIQFYLIYIGWGLSSVMLVALLTNAIMTIAQYLRSRSYLSDYFWSRAFDPMIFKRLGIYGFWSWLQTLIAIMSFQLDRLLVAAFLGTNVVAYYSIASMIANHLHMALEAMVGWVFPAVSRIVNQNRDTKPLYFTVQNGLLTISLLGLGVLYFIREPLFNLWLGPEKYAAVIPFLELFILFELFYVLSITPKFFLNGLAKLRLITTIEVSYKLFSIVLMIVLFYQFKTGVSLIWGQIIALMISMPILLWMMRKRIFNSNKFTEGVGIALPNFTLFITLYSDFILIKIAGSILTIGLIYFLYLRHAKFEVDLIKE